MPLQAREAAGTNKLTLLVNPQWQLGQVSSSQCTIMQPGGSQPADQLNCLAILRSPERCVLQVISDFGWGQKKQGTEEWLATFEDTYFLKQYRIGGDAIR